MNAQVLCKCFSGERASRSWPLRRWKFRTKSMALMCHTQDISQQKEESEHHIGNRYLFKNWFDNWLMELMGTPMILNLNYFFSISSVLNTVHIQTYILWKCTCTGPGFPITLYNATWNWHNVNYSHLFPLDSMESYNWTEMKLLHKYCKNLMQVYCSVYCLLLQIPTLIFISYVCFAYFNTHIVHFLYFL